MELRIARWQGQNQEIFLEGTRSASARWALLKKEFVNLSLDHIIHNWEACMSCGPCKLRKRVSWCPPPDGILKFNVDGVTRGKPKLAGIGGVLYNSEGKVLFMFSKNVGGQRI